MPFFVVFRIKKQPLSNLTYNIDDNEYKLYKTNENLVFEKYLIIFLIFT